uniref:C-type lectin domain-containing protein n=1 Tax=Mastacembelus armatus TaxID=205130 RepID=A0A7N8XC90_9TELE
MKTLILAALLCALLALDTACQCPFTPTCPSGWTEYCGRCFVYAPKASTWGDAQKNCQSMDANLASVRNAEEYEAIKTMIAKSKGTGSAWIGGSDAQQVNSSPTHVV